MSEPHSPSRYRHDFFRYTLRPTFSSRFGIVTFPSVDAMMIVFPEEEGPNSFERSTLIVSMVPSTVISTFFMMVSSSRLAMNCYAHSHLASSRTAAAVFRRTHIQTNTPSRRRRRAGKEAPLHDRFARLKEGLERNRMPQVFFDQSGLHFLHAFHEYLHPFIVERHHDELVC